MEEAVAARSSSEYPVFMSERMEAREFVLPVNWEEEPLPRRDSQWEVTSRWLSPIVVVIFDISVISY